MPFFCVCQPELRIKLAFPVTNNTISNIIFHIFDHTFCNLVSQEVKPVKHQICQKPSIQRSSVVQKGVKDLNIYPPRIHQIDTNPIGQLQTKSFGCETEKGEKADFVGVKRTLIEQALRGSKSNFLTLKETYGQSIEMVQIPLSVVNRVFVV